MSAIIDQQYDSQMSVFARFSDCKTIDEMAGLLSTFNFSDKHPYYAKQCLMALVHAFADLPFQQETENVSPPGN